MMVKNDIVAMAGRGVRFNEDMLLLHTKKNNIPGGVQYQVARYHKHPNWNTDDVGMLVYHFDEEQGENSYLELKYCLTGNMYCKSGGACSDCQEKTDGFCGDRQETLDVLSFRFEPDQLALFAKGKSKTDFTYSIFNFEHRANFSKILPLCNKMRGVLEAVLNTGYESSLENIFVNAQTQILLLYSMECMIENPIETEAITFTCKFLANDPDREKVTRARQILLDQLGEPITIKELSRKVAMNECYLKKGFKEMFGTTIFEFYQSQRMEHAKYLLYEKSLSVTDVSIMLGYSSISHFSTAFKKQTGLKPCELLLR